jgi:DNA mismatch repair protein MSH2
MGGKSTFMKKLALIVILAQIGSFVPARMAALPVFDAVLVRVGAGDSLARGISTFPEMLEMAAILRTATANSLVLIDELGRGTSTNEGFGIAWAISKHIASNIRPFCLFATHFHELTRLASQFGELFGNLCVRSSVSDGKLMLEYVVEPGVCDRSFGIECAKLAGFPVKVRRQAAARLAVLEGRVAPDPDCVCWIENAIRALESTPEPERLSVLNAHLNTAPDSLKHAFQAIMNA